MKADTITKDYLSDAAVFADVFNYYIHDGEQVICPEQLEERDPTEIALPYGADGAAVPVQKFRDAQKLYTAMTDGNLEYVLYGIEAQAEIHYAAAVKNNLYDAIEYAGQVEEAARSHRRAMKQAKEQKGDASAAGLGKPNSGEFLSGFWKSDKLVPSVTVMLYFSPDAWDGPLSLFDLSRILETNEKRFREVERRAADVIETITHTGLKYDESEEVVDVCQAIQEMRKESERDGELKKAKEAAGNFYNLGVDVEKIAQGVGYAVETVKEWLGLE